MLQLEVIGNIGKDADAREVNGKRYICFNVASSRKQKNGEIATTWIQVLYGNVDSPVYKYLTKGTKVFVRGDMVASAYSDKYDKPAISLGIYAREIELLGGGQHDNAHPASQGPTGRTDTPKETNDPLPF